MDPLQWQQRLRPVLTPVSRLYERLMAARRAKWEAADSPAFRPSRPCVSVGNIAWGGTGKTPIVDWLLGWSEAHGLRAVVLSRGYKAAPPELPLRVRTSHTPGEAGDEPLMLALEHPESVIMVDPDRRRSGRRAEEDLRPDLFVLDDGFQHVKVRRDLDLVLLRPDDLGDGWGRVIPAGAWREGRETLDRADAFMIKCPPEAWETLRPACERRLAGFGRPLFTFVLRPVCLRSLHGNERREAGDFAGGSYAVASGVGDPVQVVRTVAAFMGYPPAETVAFPDHHVYGAEDAARLERLGMPVICTCKDAVKLRDLPLSDVWALRVEAAFGPRLWSEAAFPGWLDAWARGKGLIETDSLSRRCEAERP